MTIEVVDLGPIGDPEVVDVIMGPQGPQGPEGPDGPQGPEGPQGPQGDTGDEGAEGAEGPQGEPGYPGPTGPGGPPGADGGPGPEGPDGAVGPEGPDGPQGLQGDIGPTGLTGLAGVVGPEGPEGPEGPQGDPGPEGDIGELGPAGPIGESGEDGREIELQLEAAGVQWRYFGEVTWSDLIPLEDITGPTGPASTVPGPAGEQGIQGEQGESGLAGEDGREVELQAGETALEWRHFGDPTWSELVLIEDITGADSTVPGPAGDTGPAGDAGPQGAAGDDGREVELQEFEGTVQWRYLGDVTWNDLYAIPEGGGGLPDGDAVAVLVGDGVSTSFTVTHSLDSYNVGIEVWRMAGGRQTVYPIVSRPTLDTVHIDFADTVITTNSHLVLVSVGAGGGGGGGSGEDGREVELRTVSDTVQWRYVGEAWTDLFELPEGGGGVPPYVELIGDSVESSFTVTHEFGTFTVAVEVWDVVAGRQTVYPLITRPTVDTVLVDFAGTVIATNSHLVLVSASQAGPQGPQGADGPTGAAGPAIFAFSYAGDLAVATGPHRLYNDTGTALTISKVRASVGTAPTGAAVIIDVNKDNVTIFTTQANRPTVAIGANTNLRVPDVTVWSDGDYLSVDIDQIGSATPGADLTVTVTALPSNQLGYGAGPYGSGPYGE